MARSRDAVIDACSRVDGWMSEQALGWLYDRAQKIRPYGRWVEIGVYAGRSFLAVLEGLCREAVLIGVDDFRGVPKAKTGFVLYQEFVRNMRLSSRRDYCMLVRSSQAAALKFCDGSIDAVFIDASHDELSVKSDIVSWLPKLCVGGLLAGHDYSDHSVQAALKLLPNVQKEVGDIWSYRK